MTVIGHGTVDELRAVISEVDIASGLINRMLFCCVRRSKLLPDGGWVEDAVLRDYSSRLGEAIRRGAGLQAGARPHTGDAARWREVYGALTADRPACSGAQPAEPKRRSCG